jgi:translocation and assembly module TamB
LRIAGPPDRHLALTGDLRPVRGWYEPPVFSRQFDFESGQATFTGDPVPFLDLELVNHSPELTAIIKIEGPARQPRITLTSRPPMNQDEVAGRLLFGKSPSSLSRLEAVQLAAMLRDLTNFGGDSLNPFKTVRRSLGLDVLRLGGSSGHSERQVSDLSGSMAGDLNSRAGAERADYEAVSIEAGKYINDNIYNGGGTRRQRPGRAAGSGVGSQHLPGGPQFPGVQPGGTGLEKRLLSSKKSERVLDKGGRMR